MKEILKYREEFFACVVVGALWFSSKILLGDLVYGFGSQERFIAVISVLTSLYGTALGILLAVMALLFNLIEGEKFRLLRQSKHYGELWWIFKAGVRACALALIANVMSLGWVWLQEPNISIVYLIVGCFVWVALRVRKIIWVLERIMDLEIAKGRHAREAREV